MHLHAPLNEGDGDDDRVSRSTAKPQTSTLAERRRVGRRPRRRQGLHDRSPATTVEVADAGDFEQDQAVLLSAPGSSCPEATAAAPIVARMDDQNDYRGWDLWVEDGRVGTHIIHKWPDDALKVVANEAAQGRTSGTHVLVTYDGSGKAGGVKVYVDGEPQADRRRGRQARRARSARRCR